MTDRARERDQMISKLTEVATIIGGVVVILIRAVFCIFESLYKMLVPPPEKSVAGEIVLVTGSGHGIGRELAIQYGELGAIVVGVDINQKGNEETKKIMTDRGLNRIHIYTCDVTNRDQVISTVEKIQKEVGHVSILVNNAGLMPAHKFLDHKPEEIIKMFEVNVFAQFWLLQAILPNMIKTNHGHIVAMSSIAGLVGLQNLVPYCASKFAVRGLMEALAEELREQRIGTNIKFTGIFPYMVNTGLCKKPRIRFQTLSMVEPQEAAAVIIRTMRRNEEMATIPSFFLPLNNVLRMFPIKVGQIVKDFTDSGVEATD